MYENNRILVVDDNELIHEDFRKILSSSKSIQEEEYIILEQDLFGNDFNIEKVSKNLNYEVDSAFQGQEALEKVRQAEEEEKQYSLIFMDVRMPPGWDGIETISKIWKLYPNIEMVICSAYSDYSWEDIIAELGTTDKLLFLRKPFDPIEVQQIALSLLKKASVNKKLDNYVRDLETKVQKNTKQLKSMVKELIESRDKLKEEIFTHKMIEESLHVNMKMFTSIFNSVSSALIKVDLINNISFMNKKAKEILEFESEEDIVNVSLENVFKAVDENYDDLSFENNKNNNLKDKTCYFINQNGKKKAVKLNSFALKDKDDEMLGNLLEFKII